MTQRATGTFEVKMIPQAGETPDAVPARLLLDKQFHGDIEGTGKGQMLAAGTAVAGSAGYVAIEQITGTVHGLSGSFILQHTGKMTRGVPEMNISVVPDSGTGELTGIRGKFVIVMSPGKHAYEFDYEIAAS